VRFVKAAGLIPRRRYRADRSAALHRLLLEVRKHMRLRRTRAGKHFTHYIRTEILHTTGIRNARVPEIFTRCSWTEILHTTGIRNARVQEIFTRCSWTEILNMVCIRNARVQEKHSRVAAGLKSSAQERISCGFLSAEGKKAS